MLFSSLSMTAVKSSFHFGYVQCQFEAWLSCKMEEVVMERHNAVVSHKSDEEHRAYISPSLRAFSIITKIDGKRYVHLIF